MKRSNAHMFAASCIIRRQCHNMGTCFLRFIVLGELDVESTFGDDLFRRLKWQAWEIPRSICVDSLRQFSCSGLYHFRLHPISIFVMLSLIYPDIYDKKVQVLKALMELHTLTSLFHSYFQWARRPRICSKRSVGKKKGRIVSRIHEGKNII